MKNRTWLRLLGVLLTGLILFGMVFGSIQLGRLDPMMVVETETPAQVILLPTRTLYPTSVPEATPTATGIPTVTDTVTPAAAATETEVAPTPTSTLTSTPSSPLVEGCDYPQGWLPFTVGNNDTVYSLALKANTTTRLLLEANCMGTADDIVSGSTLYLPPIAFASPTPQPYVCGPPPSWRIVVVKPGETLYALAIRYGTTVDAIMKANCLNTTTLYAGQPLYVPPYIVVYPTATQQPWPTPTYTATPLTPTATNTPEGTATATIEPTLTPTPSPTWTPGPTLTPGPTGTPTPVPPKPTPTYTPTPEFSPTPTPTATEIPSLTPTATITPIPSLTPTWTPTTPVTTTVSSR